MMMAYGLFVFSVPTAAYQKLRRQSQWRHESQSRIGERPVRQYLGPGDDSITLTGTLLPQFTGGQQSLDDLRDMANQGYAWPLIEGTGRNHGVYVITDLNEDKSAFFRDGAASEIAFELTLERVEDDRAVRIGTLTADDLNSAALGRSLRGVFG